MTLHAQPRPAVRAPGNVLRYGTDAWTRTGAHAMRGITLGPIENSQHPGVGYGSPACGEALDEIRDLGANWVSLTPFGRQWDLASTDIRMDFETPWPINRARVAAAVDQAHARGLRVFLIPHLWIDRGGWRGEIGEQNHDGAPHAFTNAQWRRWFEGYTRFVLRWAEVAQATHADMFSVGVELKSSSSTRGEWFDVIAAIRRAYHGPLTYSSNWDEAPRVIFWDRLDIVGIQAFYPLATQPGDGLDALRTAAIARADDLAQWAERNQRAVMFTEYGYTARPDPTLRPWEWPDDLSGTSVDAHAQAIAYRALLEAFVPRPWFVGAFAWRYYANPMDSSQEPAFGFSPRGREAETVLRDLYDPALPWGADPALEHPFPW